MIKVLKRGFPEMLSQLATPITIFCMNLVIAKYIRSNGINAYSAVLGNILRCFIFTPLCVIILSHLSNGGIVWSTIGIAEATTFVSAMAIMKNSEKGGIKFDKK